MSAKKQSSLDRVLGRLDNLDTVNLTNLVQRLARERGLLEAVFNTVREGILVVDEHGVIEYSNHSARRMIGLKETEVGSATLWRLVPGLRQSLDLKSDEAIGRRSAITREIELNYPEPRFVRLYMVPFRESAAEPATLERFVVILSDITQEKLSTREQIEGERISSIILLAAGVAHELGNPLNSLTIHLQLIERQLKRMEATPQASKMNESIRICQDEVSRLDGIIRNFLEAIRPRPPDLQPVNLFEILDTVLAFQKGELEDRGLTLEVTTGQEPPVVSADANQIKQVFFNLIKNAMEAMQSGGVIRIRSWTDDDWVYFQVGDTGKGIAEEDLSQVFQPFHTTKSGGSGLGLMIVQRIMRDHGGQIGIESREGQGTLVTLQFPFTDRRVRLLRE
ncbi:MAG: ATP-binding protein [Opitutaceae bacterium]